MVSLTFFEEGEDVTEANEWNVDIEEYEDEEQGWVEKADAYHGNHDEWDERSPPDDGEMEERSGSLEPAGALATMKIENASFEMQSAARNFVDARKLVALVTSTRGFFPAVGVGAFDGLQSMAPRASAGTEASGKGEGASAFRNRGRGIGNGELDARRPFPAKFRQTSGGHSNS